MIAGTVNAGTVDISNNNFERNSPYAVTNNTAVTVTAENSWWNAADGPSGQGTGGGDAVSTMVDFQPWLTAPAEYGDGDGLGYCREIELGTDPEDPDTDGDGFNDGDELAAGTDPLDPNDFPAAVGGTTTATKPLALFAPLAALVLAGLVGSAAFVSRRRPTNQ